MLEEEDHDSSQPRDAAIDEAIPKVLAIFEAEPTRVFYSTQIETRLEREVFHWITNKALAELANAMKLQRIAQSIRGTTVNFYAHPRHRYWRRELVRLAGLLERVFDPEFTQVVGRHAELLFDAALARHGFSISTDRNVNAWAGKTWTETKHNLDRIVTRDGVAYGIEIKNKQNYIERDELVLKLRLCNHLGLRPLFIMRFAPKSYIHDVAKAGGFCLLFEEQFYPWGHADLLRDVRETLGLKVHSPRDVKDGDMRRLVQWHEKKLAGR